MAQGALAPAPVFIGWDSNGDPLAGGLLYTYLSGTSTPYPVYTNSSLTVAHTNPVVLNSAGRATIYMDTTSLKFILKDADGVTIWTVDPVSTAASSDTNITGTAGEDIVAGNAVFMSDGSNSLTAGYWYKTDADNTWSSTVAQKLGMAVEDIASGETGSIMIVGRMTGLVGLTPGSVYYADQASNTAAGEIIATPPTNAAAICIADSATTAIVGEWLGWANTARVGMAKLTDYYTIDFNVSTGGDDGATFIQLQDVPERFNYSEDFIVNAWQGVYTGTAAAIEYAPVDGIIGRQSFQTGGTVNSVCTVHPRAAATTAVAIFNNANYWKCAVGSDGTASRSLTAGCGTDISSATFGTDSIYFLYNSSVSANWICRSRAGGVETSTTTSIAFTADSDWMLHYVFDLTTDTISFYISSTLVATHTTNFPAHTVAFTPGVRFENLAGSNMKAWIDDIRLYNDQSGR